MKKYSRIGFGCYRVDERVREHYESLVLALTEGINLIDTSANYADGRSEILVGNVMTDLISSQKIKRDDITIVTKGGYIQGQNYRFAHKKKEQGHSFNDVVEYDTNLWHCISPDFLEDQISRQLFRLGQNDDDGYIDVYLLHNPEYYLAHAEKTNFDLFEARNIYYHRIKTAFEFLEEKSGEGKIKSYGISSNTFPSSPDNFDFTSLEKVLDAAKSVSRDNNFRFIELPLNLIESGAIFEKNQLSKSATVLELARDNGLEVLINRPLNAITNTGLVRLADFEVSDFSDKELLRQIKLLTLLEEDLVNEKLAGLNISDENLGTVKTLLTFGGTMSQNWKLFGTIEHLNDIIEHHITPRIDYLIQFFDENISDDGTTDSFENYMKEVFRMLNYLTNYYKFSAERRSKYLHSIINDCIDDKYHALSLSQKAIALINSVEGVSCVLVGARKEKYVEDATKILNYERIDNAESVFKKIQNEIFTINN